MGVLYEQSLLAIVVFSVAVQAAALPLFLAAFQAQKAALSRVPAGAGECR
jgi:hypothetical protein